MAAIVECQIIPDNFIITWRILTMEITATPNNTNKNTWIDFVQHSKLSNPANKDIEVSKTCNGALYRDGET